jgi:hypothetical protein
MYVWMFVVVLVMQGTPAISEREGEERRDGGINGARPFGIRRFSDGFKRKYVLCLV